MNINVSPDGFVDLGNNNWVSLDRIQQAVLHATNPELHANAPEGEPRKRPGFQTLNINKSKSTITTQEHLALPWTAPAKECNCQCNHGSIFEHEEFPKPPLQTSSSGQEHLPLPQMVFPVANQKASKPTSNGGEQHLIPLSTMRRKK